MDNGDPCWILVSRTSISIKKSKVRLFKSKLYEEKDIYKTAKAAETLRLLYLDDLTPAEMQSPVLKSFTNAVLHCRSFAEIVTLLHGVYHHLHRATGEASSDVLQSLSYFHGTMQALPLSKTSEESLEPAAPSISAKIRIERKKKLSLALIILIFGITIAAGGYILLDRFALLTTQKHEGSPVPRTPQFPITKFDQRQDREPGVKPVEEDSRVNKDTAAESKSQQVPIPSAALPERKAIEGTQYSLQIEAFKNEKNAEALSKELQRKGYNAIVNAPLQGDGTKLYRVLIGSFENRKDAVQAATAFQAKEKRQVIIFSSNFRR
jgi:hypothetical protein